jgi:hypothetical protein
MITGGYMILDKGNDQYYFASIYSGNLNFFKGIELLKLTDLTLASANHDWNLTDMNLSHTTDQDYLYPLCEASDDGGMTTVPHITGNTVELFGGWVWPFVKIKTIWDEIFSNAQFTCDGDILTNDTFLKLFMPIVNLTPPNISTVKYLYSLDWTGRKNFVSPVNTLSEPGAILIVGTNLWRDTGIYTVPYTALYKFRVGINQAYIDGAPVPDVYIYKGGIAVATLAPIRYWGPGGVFAGEYAATAGDVLRFAITDFNNCTGYSLAVTEIVISTAAFGIAMTPHINLPDLTQIEFIKTICNMFALIPDVTARDKKIKFWNYSDLYDNIPNARDWSAYLSEQDDETEYKFGDYAQRNYIKYKESKDVILGNGDATIEIDDVTLPAEKDVVQFPVCTCDEIVINFTAPTVNVSRIAFNNWYDNTGTWKVNSSIDPRIVYVKTATGKTLKIWDTVAMNINSVTVTDPRIASSLEVSASFLVTNYAGLSRLLAKTNLRRAKFNLPVYEVAGMKHYIPIYLSQYKAYFYVNKINNYVPGQLCTIDLIKL